MFEYYYDKPANVLYVTLPAELRFGVAFLNEMTELISRISDDDCREVRVSCLAGAKYDNMSKAYILSVLCSFLSSKSVWWSKDLENMIDPKVHVRDGSRFNEVDMVQVCANDELDYYIFRDDETVSKPVNEMTRLLVEKNVTLNTDQIKEFLATTIGEIFSNCFLHSNEDEAFFMFDVKLEKKNFYLCVNITDYGTPLVNNVRSFFENNNENIDSIAAFEWAMREGTTTRAGSGGYGLATLTDYISHARGELYIFSGDAYYSFVNAKAEVQYSKGIFLGTSVTFRVKLYETSQIMTYDSAENKLETISLDNI